MMVVFGILIVLLGLLLLLRPQVWAMLNAPEGEKHRRLAESVLRATRIRGITFLVGGTILLLLQLLR